MMYIDPKEEAIALNLSAISEFLQDVKGKGVPAVLFVIFSKCSPNNHAYITAAQIADHTGLSAATVRRAIKRLCDSKIIAKLTYGEFYINPDVAFRGEQSSLKKMEFSIASKDIA